MLPKLLNKTDWWQNLFLTLLQSSGNLSTLETSPDIEDQTISDMYLKSPQKAEAALLHKINRRKKETCTSDEWRSILFKRKSSYATAPAFQYTDVCYRSEIYW